MAACASGVRGASVTAMQRAMKRGAEDEDGREEEEADTGTGGLEGRGGCCDEEAEAASVSGPAGGEGVGGSSAGGEGEASVGGREVRDEGEAEEGEGEEAGLGLSGRKEGPRTSTGERSLCPEAVTTPLH